MADTIVNTEEVWRPVVGWEGIYSVSNIGRIRRDLGDQGSRPGYILKASKRDGYPVLTLRRKGRVIKDSIHHLVAEAFIGPRPSGYTVNHINGIKTDNNPENLEYSTLVENAIHSLNVLQNIEKVRGPFCYTAKFTEAQIFRIRGMKSAEISYRKIANVFGVDPSCIYKIIKRKTWKHL